MTPRHLTQYYQEVVTEVQYAFTDGEVSSTRVEVDDSVQQSLAMKAYSRSLGADLVGFSDHSTVRPTATAGHGDHRLAFGG